MLSRAFLSSRVLVQTASAANCYLIWLYPAWSGSMIFSRLCQNNDQRSGWFQSPGFQDSRIPGFQGSRVPGSRFQYPRFQGPGLQGSTGVPEVRSFKVPGFQDRGSRVQSFKVPGFQGSRVPGSVFKVQGSKIPGFLVQVAFTVPGFQGFQGSKSSRAPEVSKVQKFQSSRVPGLGFQGFRAPGFQGSRAIPGAPAWSGSMIFQGFVKTMT